jgi:hypothetical protein
VIWHASVRISAWQTHQPHSPVNSSATTQVRGEMSDRGGASAGSDGDLVSDTAVFILRGRSAARCALSSLLTGSSA